MACSAAGSPVESRESSRAMTASRELPKGGCSTPYEVPCSMLTFSCHASCKHAVVLVCVAASYAERRLCEPASIDTLWQHKSCHKHNTALSYPKL